LVIHANDPWRMDAILAWLDPEAENPAPRSIPGLIVHSFSYFFCIDPGDLMIDPEHA
jgi:hypothetical protein